MSISGISGTSNYNFSNYQTRGTYGSHNKTTSTETQVQEGKGRPDGPPPPPKGGGKGQGPDLDTDSDGLWSTEELDAYASYSSSTLGIELDTENLLTTYDTDEDGTISSDERVALAKDNAFKLPSPQDMMQQMKGFGSPPQIKSADSSTESVTETTTELNLQMIQQLIEAYNQQNSSIYASQNNVSSVTYEA